MDARRGARVLGHTLVGGLVAAGAAYAVLVGATTVVPCIGEKLGCNIGDAVGTIEVMAGTPVAMLVFGLLAYFTGRRRVLALAAALLCSPIVVFLLLAAPDGLTFISNNPAYLSREVQGLFQMAVPIFVVILVTWLIVRRSVDPAGPTAN